MKGNIIACCLLETDDLPWARGWQPAVPDYWMTELLLTHTHTQHTHSLLSVPAGAKTQPLGQGPAKGSGGQRRSPQSQIQPAVSKWHGKIQSKDSTPSGALKPNSSTSLCVPACVRFPWPLLWSTAVQHRMRRAPERKAYSERMEAKAWM